MSAAQQDSDAPVPGGSRRAELLDRIVDHVLTHGIANLTLRALAAEVGSNNRMLLYYFGSRDELIVTALEAAQLRFPTLRTLPAIVAGDGPDVFEQLDRAWQLLSRPENLPFHRLFFEVFGLAGFEHDRFTVLLGEVGTDWATTVAAAFVADGVAADEAERLAHEIVALWRGLQVTLISTGDHALADRVAAGAVAALRLRLRPDVR